MAMRPPTKDVDCAIVMGTEMNRKDCVTQTRAPASASTTQRASIARLVVRDTTATLLMEAYATSRFVFINKEHFLSKFSMLSAGGIWACKALAHTTPVVNVRSSLEKYKCIELVYLTQKKVYKCT